MFVESLKFPGVLLITPEIFRDERGFFFENYREPLYQAQGIPRFVQDSLSFSKKGTIRGLHYQENQAKLVSCVQGKILDVIVDLRRSSPTFGQWEALELDDQKKEQVFIPSGCAHGFCALSDAALVYYKVSAVYNPQNERSIRWNDPDIAILWPIQNPILSKRDRSSPFFQEVFREALDHR